MGNCVDKKFFSQEEMLLETPQDSKKIKPDYLEKTTDDKTLKVLTSEKSRPPQQARTYKSGSVQVSVF